MRLMIFFCLFLIYPVSTQRACNLYCDERSQSESTASRVNTIQGPPGKRGPMGSRGEKGNKGDMCGCNCTVLERLSADMNEIQKNACPGVTYHFPRSNQTEDYVWYRSYVPQMKEATVCAWIESDGFSDRFDTVLSYATNSIDNELIIYLSPQAFNTSISNQIRINSRNVPKSFPLAVSQGKFHLCAWVSSIQDKGVVFVNGSKVDEHDLIINGQLKGGGSLIMGQEQDLVNVQQLDPRQAFKGNITNLMIWPRVLTQQEIMSIASSCNCPPDYAVAMTTDRSELHGRVSYFVPEECPTL